MESLAEMKWLTFLLLFAREDFFWMFTQDQTFARPSVITIYMKRRGKKGNIIIPIKEREWIKAQSMQN